MLAPDSHGRNRITKGRSLSRCHPSIVSNGTTGLHSLFDLAVSSYSLEFVQFIPSKYSLFSSSFRPSLRVKFGGSNDVVFSRPFAVHLVMSHSRRLAFRMSGIPALLTKLITILHNPSQNATITAYRPASTGA
jgi:hypothetical protein